MTLMACLFIVELNLNKEWVATEQQNTEDNFFNSPESTEIETRIFRIDMALAFFGFINFVIIAFYLFNNYQNVVDRWRKFRGIKSKALLATLKDEELDEYQH